MTVTQESTRTRIERQLAAELGREVTEVVTGMAFQLEVQRRLYAELAAGFRSATERT